MGISMEKKIKQLTIYLRGWIYYFGIAEGYQKCIDLDSWIRRRLRMSYWKQWRKVRTKVKNLVRRGVPLDKAIGCGMSSKSYWRNSRTYWINFALSDKHFEESGLISLRDLWVKIHYGTGIADCGPA